MKNKTIHKRFLKAKCIYAGLEFSTKQINTSFIIKVDGKNPKVKRLVGVSGLIKLIGIRLTNTLLKKAFESKQDKLVCKLRRGLKITFCSH